MKSRSFSSLAVLIGSLILSAGPALAQLRGVQAASVMPPSAVQLKEGQDVVVPLKVMIKPGHHMNSDKPGEDYMIPTKLTWEAPGLNLKSVEYPPAETIKYDFAEKPLSVFSGAVTMKSTFSVPASVPADLKELTGKLRYQACTDKMCLPPVTLDIHVPVAR